MDSDYLEKYVFYQVDILLSKDSGLNSKFDDENLSPAGGLLYDGQFFHSVTYPYNTQFDIMKIENHILPMVSKNEIICMRNFLVVTNKIDSAIFPIKIYLSG